MSSRKSVVGRTAGQPRSVRAFFMAMPPVVLICFFAGLPILLAVGYSLGHTGGLNAVTASYALHQHLSLIHI